jgi:hypothetical protein
MPLSDVSVRNTADFQDDFGSRVSVREIGPGPAFTHLFNKHLAAFADNASLVFDSAFASGEMALRDTGLFVPAMDSNRMASFSIPDPSAFRKKGLEPDMALQISHLVFERISRTDTGFNNPPPMFVDGKLVSPLPTSYGPQVAKTLLGLSGSYILWDYRKNDAVAYGRFETASSFDYAMTYSDWESVIRQAVEIIVGNSPLKGKKYDAAMHPNTYEPKGMMQ